MRLFSGANGSRPWSARFFELVGSGVEHPAAGGQRRHIRHGRTLQSAYRNYAEDGRAWGDTFAEFYEDSRPKRDALRGGPHGDTAVAMFVAEMVGRKAPPGWSNHSNGMAVDFNTTYEGFLCAARKKHAARWRRSWLHPWLVANASKFQFYPLSTEEWHWDYR